MAQKDQQVLSDHYTIWSMQPVWVTIKVMMKSIFLVSHQKLTQIWYKLTNYLNF